MGSSLSCTHRSSISHQPPSSPAPAMVIAADGSLSEFPASSSAVAVSDVLGGNAGFFLCSSDALYFDVDVPELAGGELLRPGQIYFLLPEAMLGRPLSSTDMAALAVRASAALAAATRLRARRSGGGRKKVRVMPVHAERDGSDGLVNEKLNERTLGEPVMASPDRARSSEKLATAAAVRWPPKRALSTIEEDVE